MRFKASIWILLLLILAMMVSYAFVGLGENRGNENRTMATFRMVLFPEKDSVVYYDSPVERLNAALSDQIPFREKLMKWYLNIFNASENLVSRLFGKDFTERENEYALQTVGNYALISDTGYLTDYPTAEAYDPELVTRHIGQIEKIHTLFPETKIYVYFVTQAFDMPWFDAYIGKANPDHYAEIRKALPEYVQSGCLVYRNLEDYRDIHYKTDHHWNHRGARRGYEDIHAMMGGDAGMGEKRTPVAENIVSETWQFVYLGSYGRALGDLYKDGYDDFGFYEYDIPARECSMIDPDTLEEIRIVKIGLYEEYRNGEMNRETGTEHYAALYETAVDTEGNRHDDSSYVYVIRNSEGNGRNLLICGDSHNRAMRDLLAAHFDTTVYLDYRLIDRVPVDWLMEKYQIDVLLISSNSSMWNDERYFLTFREGQ